MGIYACLLLVAVAASTPPPAAEDPAAQHDSAEELTGANPARLIPRLEARHQVVVAENDARIQTTTLRMDVRFLRRLMLRYEQPLVTIADAGIQRSGFGDVQVKALTLLSSGPRHAVVAITGLTLDTATRPTLGIGKQVVAIGLGGAFKPRPWSLLFGVGEGQLSFAGDEQRRDVRRLIASLGTVVFGPQRDWYLLDLVPQVDFADETRARLFGSLEVGRLLDGRVGLFVRAGTQVLGQREVEYTLAAGARYMFRLSRD